MALVMVGEWNRPAPTGAAVHRLRRGDLANLWVEGPDTPSQIALLARFDATAFLDGAGRLDGQRVRDALAARARRVPELTRRIRWTRPGEGPSVWVSDPAPDPAAHIACVRLPPDADLVAWAGARAVRPLDRTRPLWRAEIVPDLPGRRFAVLLVVHHAVADGLAGVAILTALLDPAPGGADPAPPPAVPSAPGRGALVVDNLRTRGAALAAATRRIPRVPAALRRVRAQLRDAAGDLRSVATPTSLHRPVGPGRRLAVRRAPLADLAAAGHALDATVNDLLLAAVAAGLRDLLLARGEDPGGLALRASFPVGALPGQRAGMLLIDLPAGEPDPVRRLAAVRATTAALKSRVRRGGGQVFDVLRLPTPLARLAVRWMRRGAARRITLFVTNVPGPPHPLWLAGARLVDAAPIAPLTADVPVGVAALSYAGTLAVAVNADAAVTDVAVLADGIERSLRAAGSRYVPDVPYAPPRAGT